MKTAFVCLLILFSTRLSIAQSKIGFVVFPQISSVSNSAIRSDTVNKNLLTFSGGGGIVFTTKLLDKVSVQIGLLYSSQNQKIKSSYHSSSLNIEHTGKKRFDYLKLPLLIRYSIPLGGKTNFIPFAGIQLSYLLKYLGGMVIYGKDFFDLPSTPVNNNYYKKMVMDIPLGITIEYAISKRVELTVGFKLDYALTDVANRSATYNGVPLS